MKCSELLRKLQKGGWQTVRQTGSHLIMEHPDKSGQIIFPSHGSKEMKKGLAEKLLKQAGLK
jgi:predicted RNA binding protein YcfA (HicA-like mRNA interferase family)